MKYNKQGQWKMEKAEGRYVGKPSELPVGKTLKPAPNMHIATLSDKAIHQKAMEASAPKKKEEVRKAEGEGKEKVSFNKCGQWKLEKAGVHSEIINKLGLEVKEKQKVRNETAGQIKTARKDLRSPEATKRDPKHWEKEPVSIKAKVGADKKDTSLTVAGIGRKGTPSYTNTTVKSGKTGSYSAPKTTAKPSVAHGNQPGQQYHTDANQFRNEAVAATGKARVGEHGSQQLHLDKTDKPSKKK